MFAQKEGNIWYFGKNAGIDFNSGAPVALTDGALNTSEGCASICDAQGNLLFYTDGSSIWSQNHQVMPNGYALFGHASSTQSAIIVKKPGLNSIYLVFTITQLAGIHGLCYSEVDMSLNQGWGDVNSIKNINLVSHACEKITAIKHKNNVDYWIITKLFNSDAFYSYLLSETGVNPIPVQSNVGITVADDFHFHSIGYLRASPDGKRIACANQGIFTVELFDFDKTTGYLNNPISLNNVNSMGIYGVEFSPNNKLLYVSEKNNIIQYEVTAGSAAAILNSRKKIGSDLAPLGAIQLGPDKRIYIARGLRDSLGVINEPDLLGNACNYVHNGFYLAGKKSTIGLPTFTNSVYDFTPNDETVPLYDNRPMNYILPEATAEVDFEMPNIFTPNGDGSNDLFIPAKSKGITEMHTLIYNRWGGQVFETKNLMIEWDGKDLADGTYFWVILYTDVNGEQKTLNGHLTLVR